jgi:hypothetical protein
VVFGLWFVVCGLGGLGAWGEDVEVRGLDVYALPRFVSQTLNRERDAGVKVCARRVLAHTHTQTYEHNPEP